MPRAELDEDPLPQDIERFGGDTRPCPSCGTATYDDAQWCHKCGAVLETAADSRPKPWVYITAAALVAAFLFFLLR